MTVTGFSAYLPDPQSVLLPGHRPGNAARHPAALVLIVVLVASCSGRGQDAVAERAAGTNTEAVPGRDIAATTPAAHKNPSAQGSKSAGRQPALAKEYRILLTPELEPAAVTELVAQAAASARLPFSRNGQSKCRLVQLLDLAWPNTWLREHGFILRLRERLDPTCTVPTNVLAASFNRRIGDREDAESSRHFLAPAKNLPIKRAKERFKHITAISEAMRSSYYWVGGTVRMLDERPADLAALRALFPALSDIDRYQPDAKLQPVGALCVGEHNYDLGTVAVGSQGLPVELAVWHRWKGDGSGPSLVSELLYPRVASPKAERFADELDRRLHKYLHWAETREVLIYHLATHEHRDRGPASRCSNALAGQ
ncbi:MAG: hypothetical protein MJE77_42120 [Proteobacteria bacterium]|nr:hypothetical protein [Pseudomonadota bacterium]